MHADALLTPHVLMYGDGIFWGGMLARQDRARLIAANWEESQIERPVEVSYLGEGWTRRVGGVVVRGLVVGGDVAVACVAWILESATLLLFTDGL